MTPEQFTAHRKNMSLSQTQIGQRLGLSLRQIQRYEKTETPIPKTVAILIDVMDTRRLPKKNPS
jgi:transcriptional regulator with XRE-family HTH domain